MGNVLIAEREEKLTQLLKLGDKIYSLDNIATQGKG